MDIKETLQEAGQKLSEGAKNVKDAIVAKLSEENAQTPQQRLKNAQAMLDGAKVVERQAKTALQAVQAEGEKLKRYAASSEAKGDMAGVQKFETMMQDILAKIPDLEADYSGAVAKCEALESIVDELKAKITEDGSQKQETCACSENQAAPLVEQIACPASAESVITSDAPVLEAIPEGE